MERNTVERAIKTEIDTNKKGVVKLGWFMSKTSTATYSPRDVEPAWTPKERNGSENVFPYFVVACRPPTREKYLHNRSKER